MGKGADGKSTLNLVVEAKDKSKIGLALSEEKRISHAERGFLIN
jgi:restriction endonuclease